MRKPTANASPAPPRFVRRRTLRALQNTKINAAVAMCGCNSIQWLGNSKTSWMDVWGLLGVIMFLGVAAAQIGERSHSPQPVSEDEAFLTASVEKASVRQNVGFVALTTVFLAFLLVSVPLLVVGEQRGGGWWRETWMFNAYAILVTNYAGWATYRGWRALYDYARETRPAAPIVAPIIAPQVAPTSGATVATTTSAPPVLMQNSGGGVRP